VSLSVASIVSVVIFLIVAYSCHRNGLFSTLATLFIMVFSATAAVTLLVPLSRIPLLAQMGWYTQPICFMGTFLLSLVILQTLANYLYPPRLVLPRLVDVVGGSVLGLLNAYFLMGFLMVGFGLFPGTGEKEDKVVFLNADVFFAKSMALISRQTGSVALDADEFLRNIRKEKYDYRVREEKYDPLRREWRARDFADENGECFIRLQRLGTAIQDYAKANDGRYPQKLEDLVEYLPGQKTKEAIEKMLNCPVTDFPYRLFPVKSYREVEGDKNYVIMYDAVGGEAGHLGKGLGKRPVLFADRHVDWVLEGDLKALLQAQKNVKKKEE
jgi:hypothetical protein